MSKMIESHVAIITANIQKYAGEEICSQVMTGSEQMTSPRKIAKWLKGAIEKLDLLVDEPICAQILENCGEDCLCLHGNATKGLIAKRKKYKTSEEFIDAEVKNPPSGTRLIKIGDTLHQFYLPSISAKPRRCFCPLFQGLPDEETVSTTFCYCSKGFIKKAWESVLEKPVRVELIESCIAGAKECHFIVHIS